LSVTNTLGAKPCFLSSLRMSFAAALLSRRRCTNRTRTSPSSSTARHSQNCLLAIRTASRRDATARSADGVCGEAFTQITARTSKPSASPSRRRHPARARLDITKAEGEAEIEPHRVPDDNWRKSMTGVRDRRHATTLRSRANPNHRYRDIATLTIPLADLVADCDSPCSRTSGPNVRAHHRRAAAIVGANGLERALESCQDWQDWRLKAFTEHHARKSHPRDRSW
jgi:hypothetical protein